MNDPATLTSIIEEASDLVVVGEAGDGIELLSLLKKTPTEMVILDTSMPNLRGIEATREIKMTYPDIKILILTMHKKMDYAFYALAAGEDGYLLKEDTEAELFSAIEHIRRDKTYVSSSLKGDLTDKLVQIQRGVAKPSFELLTIREREVLKLIAEGKSSGKKSPTSCLSACTRSTTTAPTSSKNWSSDEPPIWSATPCRICTHCARDLGVRRR